MHIEWIQTDDLSLVESYTVRKVNDVPPRVFKTNYYFSFSLGAQRLGSVCERAGLHAANDIPWFPKTQWRRMLHDLIKIRQCHGLLLYEDVFLNEFMNKWNGKVTYDHTRATAFSKSSTRISRRKCLPNAHWYGTSWNSNHCSKYTKFAFHHRREGRGNPMDKTCNFHLIRKRRFHKRKDSRQSQLPCTLPQ